MSILRLKEIRKLDRKGLNEKLNELHLELAKERANIAIGASVTYPGRLKEIRKTIARVETEITSRSTSEKAKPKEGRQKYIL